MTAARQPDDKTSLAETPAPPFSQAITKHAVPRVWTVFVAYLAALVGAVLVQIITALVLIVWQVAHGGDIQQFAQDLPAMMTTPEAVIALGLMSQLMVGLAAIIPAWLSREPTRARLGLVRPLLPTWGYPIIVSGALFPFAVGLGLAYALALVIEPDPSVGRLYEQMTWAVAAPFVLFIALVPGFVEEMFFRGYMQCRLLKRWSPWVAILISSALFAIMHIAPHAVLFAFAIGLWLGVLAWRTGSVWPGVVCHAFINGSWNIWQIGRKLAVFPETLPTPVIAVMGAVVLGCFLGTIWIIARRPVDIQSSAIGIPEGTAT